MALNENIRARRMQLKLSQEYVADQLGISRQAVAKWESGKSTPTASNLAELAALFEMNISELVEPENYVLKQKKQEEQVKKTQKNIKMHVGRAGAVILINTGWDGYSSGLYSAMPYFWLTILTAGLILLLVTSVDMYKKHKIKKLQTTIGALMIFSIFILPQCLPIHQTGIRYLLSDAVTAVCLIILNLKYWRYIWKPL
ncbi:helix-turn-helix transcriptional regulator [Congzhengia sp.]|uniref:helix-turn-helix domain-containing protein n=1 Tax=Congzhengia sp. TaxID=2944168 RepID=UPI0030769A7A